MLKFHILTIFPEMFTGPLNESILKRAQNEELIKIDITDIRSFAQNKHNNVDDAPYGGGAGMVMKPEPIFRAVEDVESDESKVIFLSPQGKTFDQKIAKELAEEEHLVLLCGRYEGVDERVRKEVVDEEISIGDYVLTGGELSAMVVIDAVARMIPGVLGTHQSAVEDSFYHGILDYPHYTRPRKYRSLEVPEVLLSGDHQKIADWRKKQALKRTLLRRPDLLEEVELSDEERELLSNIKKELDK
ncbi:tRNA (guanosine(37)-N1)-methyltransferase TrmD [Acetohalobium arabaticum]|uniref:tRNA (guanine-N(1)-)-methyltransferase n=1 Tax=Acetohalobium arabaticum (strain ATCC 49924 / DSM 5501 / Z-7288) TaxID=574087 RepID=D9QRM9_ACEAZ|nr:tRNA (guanosine(37)-N1)-methyltransferase TrmD [Acetohalobium arabaticum]ADL13170.1 tRNA (Guanine37-N(1)-) methyltransferase [Acetohalobium arabaticum DSM 5501]